VDFIAWYNGALVKHGERMLNAAKESFDEELSGVEIGIKIPGLHWRVKETGDNTTPRAQEITAGIINTDWSSANGYGYDPITDMMGNFQKSNKKITVLHFTCLEMNPEYNHCDPQWLVGIVADSANSNNIIVKGENALAYTGNSTYWPNIKDAIRDHNYKGLTVLRLHNIVDTNSDNTMKDIIDTYKKAGWNKVLFRGTPNSWRADSFFQEISENVWQSVQTFDGSANQRFKIDMKGDWTDNYGDNGPNNYLDKTGADIAVTQGAGIYTITIDENTLQYTVALASVRVAAPSFTPASGGVAAQTNVEIITVTPGATIYYTLDGSDPVEGGNLHGVIGSSKANVIIANPVTVKAIAVKSGQQSSTISNASYTIVEKIPAQFSIIVNSGANNESINFPGDANNWSLSANSLTLAPNSSGTVVIPNSVTTASLIRGSNSATLELKLVTGASWSNQWSFSSWKLGSGITLQDGGRQINLNCSASDQVDLTIDIKNTELRYTKK
jgi:hypothetical protein